MSSESEEPVVIEESPEGPDWATVQLALHKGRVYLALAAFLFLGLVVFIYLADDAAVSSAPKETRDLFRILLLANSEFDFEPGKFRLPEKAILERAGHRLWDLALEHENGLWDDFLIRLAVVGPIFLVLLVAAGLLVYRRAWWFVFGVAVFTLLFSGLLTYFLVTQFQLFQTLLEWLPIWLEGRQQYADFGWGKYIVFGLTVLAGYIGGILALVVLCRSDVREAFRRR